MKLYTETFKKIAGREPEEGDTLYIKEAKYMSIRIFHSGRWCYLGKDKRYYPSEQSHAEEKS